VNGQFCALVARLGGLENMFCFCQESNPGFAACGQSLIDIVTIIGPEIETAVYTSDGVT
jgi:hypothetical protein